MAENLCFVDVSFSFLKIVFCPTNWFILKQLNNASLPVSDSQLGWYIRSANAASEFLSFIVRNHGCLPLRVREKSPSNSDQMPYVYVREN